MSISEKVRIFANAALDGDREAYQDISFTLTCPNCGGLKISEEEIEFLEEVEEGTRPIYPVPCDCKGVLP